MSKPWEIDWFICKADYSDEEYSRKNRKPGERVIKAGDELWRVPTGIGPIFIDHNHWAGSYLSCDEDEVRLAAGAPALLAALENLLANNTPDTRDAAWEVINHIRKGATS